MSSIRAVLMHADAATPWAERLGFATAVAKLLDAELTTIYAGESCWTQDPFVMVSSPEAAAILREMEQQRLRQARSDHDSARAAIGSLGSWEEAGSQTPERAVSTRAMTADLLVLGQRDRRSPRPGTVSSRFIGSVVIDSGRPALVVPYIGASPKIDVVLIAWKETREAARALTAAIPFLQQARGVHVATWMDAGSDGGDGAVDVLGYLRRHGIDALHQDCGAPPGDVGEAMLSLAADLSADMLVMGCYGHSRAREHILGGATRSILEAMTIPVLMAH